MSPNPSFQSQMDNLRMTRFSEVALPELKDGHIRLNLSRFALTANNITYGAIGDAFGYWQFYPVDEKWGRIPVWGFANITESRCDGINPGDRVYGFFPMQAEFDFQPAKVTPAGFFDGAEHRLNLHPVYNSYVFTKTDPAYDKAFEDWQALFRPLFTTSFLLDHFLADNGYFGAKQIILSSASSKTAMGLAWALKQRGDVPLVGLTSKSNVGFVKSLGWYDEVHPYEDIDQIGSDDATYVDFAGNGQVRSGLHYKFKDTLRHDAVIGGAHWDQMGGRENLPGPRPSVFFAPAEGAARMKEWGAEGFQKKLGEASRAFIGEVTDQMSVRHFEGLSAVEAPYNALLDGKANPSEGYIIVV